MDHASRAHELAQAIVAKFGTNPDMTDEVRVVTHDLKLWPRKVSLFADTRRQHMAPPSLLYWPITRKMPSILIAKDFRLLIVGNEAQFGLPISWPFRGLQVFKPCSFDELHRVVQPLCDAEDEWSFSRVVMIRQLESALASKTVATT